MQTLDHLDALPAGALSSPAAQRNAAFILDVLRTHLPARGRVLEIAAGSGDHALAFASALSGLDWTPSDPSQQARDSLSAWRRAGPAGLRPPLSVDATDTATWPQDRFDVVYCA